jgi:hypothetical protein
MDLELDKKLCKLAPHLFADRRASMQVTCLCWGFDCGNGWYELLKEAATKLEPLCKAEYEKYIQIEKPWYKPVREAISFISRASFLFHILYKFASWLDPNIYNSPMHWFGGGPRASQVKEKYGGLRFYLTHGTPEMYAIVGKAESQSLMTCETCGKPGKRRGREWLYTRCNSCWKKEQRDS